MADIHALRVRFGPDGARRLFTDLARLHDEGACLGPRDAQIDSLSLSLEDQLRTLPDLLEGLAADLHGTDAPVIEARRAVADLVRQVELMIAAARACCPPAEAGTSVT